MNGPAISPLVPSRVDTAVEVAEVAVPTAQLADTMAVVGPRHTPSLVIGGRKNRLMWPLIRVRHVRTVAADIAMDTLTSCITKTTMTNMASPKRAGLNE